MSRTMDYSPASDKNGGKVTGSTCAEAILELAILSGDIAYIDNAGTLVVTSSATA